MKPKFAHGDIVQIHPARASDAATAGCLLVVVEQAGEEVLGYIMLPFGKAAAAGTHQSALLLRRFPLKELVPTGGQVRFFPAPQGVQTANPADLKELFAGVSARRN